MSLPSSGSMTPRRSAEHVVGGREGGGSRGDSTGVARVNSARWHDRPVTEDRPAPPPTAPRLDVLKALGDNTRYAIYLELARSPAPLATAEIADTLGLHANTVRPHLERMRDVGLLDVDDRRPGAPSGRPQHLYSLAPTPPSLGLEPPPWPTLARMLLAAAAARRPRRRRRRRRRPPTRAGADAAQWPAGTDCLDGLVAELARLGLRPRPPSRSPTGATVAFTHCPFRELAEANPELVCAPAPGPGRGLRRRPGRAARSTASTPSSTARPARSTSCSPRPIAIPPPPADAPASRPLPFQPPLFHGGHHVITLTDTAAAQGQGAHRRRRARTTSALRVAVRPGGCSRLQLRDVLRHRDRRRRPRRRLRPA